jgi:two-component system cell cycle response regulator DivK
LLIKILFILNITQIDNIEIMEIKKKIVLIEDNQLNLKLFCDLLEMKNFIVFKAEKGVEGILLVNEIMPDLILVDIQLQDVSGVDVIKKLKHDNSTMHIPIVAITAFAMKNDKNKILASGADYYISKPIMIDNFFEIIDTAIKNIYEYSE